MQLQMPSSLFRSFLIYASLAALSFYLMAAFEVKDEYVSGITTAVVGYTAYLVFKLNQIHALRDAAKTLVLDIRNAEDAIAGVRSGATLDAWSKLEMPERNWFKVKQQFIADLNTDEFAQFERFFRLWAGLSKAKQEIDSLKNALFQFKAQYSHQLLIDLHAVTDVAARERARKSIIDRTNDEKWVFEPDALNSSMNYFLSEIKPLTGTTGFAKLLHLAQL